MGVPPPGKAVLSMSSLSHGVIRVDTEEKLAVLTLQDVGQVMPGGETEMVFMYIHMCVCVYTFQMETIFREVETDLNSKWNSNVAALVWSYDDVCVCVCVSAGVCGATRRNAIPLQDGRGG